MLMAWGCFVLVFMVNDLIILNPLLYMEESDVLSALFPYGKFLMSATVAHTDHMTMSSTPCLQASR